MVRLLGVGDGVSQPSRVDAQKVDHDEGLGRCLLEHRCRTVGAVRWQGSRITDQIDWSAGADGYSAAEVNVFPLPTLGPTTFANAAGSPSVVAASLAAASRGALI
jgi:hypothetical protein